MLSFRVLTVFSVLLYSFSYAIVGAWGKQMELRNALRLLRSEVGMTQAELAVSLNVGFSAVNRWENQDTRPNKAASIAIIELAKANRVSSACLDALNSLLFASRAKDADDRELQKQVVQKLKTETKELLTSEQLRTTIDNLGVAVVGQRIYLETIDNLELFYYNAQFCSMFGYSEAEFAALSSQKPYFSIRESSFHEFHDKLKLLIAGELNIRGFETIVQGLKKDGSSIWIRVNGLSLKKFSFGYELFVSCIDVSSEHEANAIGKSLLRSLSGGVLECKLGRKNRLLYYSEGILHNSGFSKREFEMISTDSLVNHLVVPEDREELRELVRTQVDRNEDISATFRIVHKDNTIHWVQLSATMIREDEDGKVYHAVITRPNEFKDIHQTLFESIQTGIVVFTVETGGILFANCAWKRLHRLGCDQHPEGKNISAFFYPEELQGMEPCISEAAPVAASPGDFFCFSPDGRYFHGSIFQTTWCGSRIWICYLNDETGLYRSHQELKDLIDKIPCGIMIYEITETCVKQTYSNNYFAIKHNKPYQFSNAPDFGFVHNLDKGTINKAISSIRKGGNYFIIQIRVLANNGTFRWISVEGTVASRVEGKATLYCCYSDIDEFMATEKNLVFHQTLLKQALNETRMVSWKYDYRTHTISEANDYGAGFNLPKFVSNVPQSLISRGMVERSCEQDFRELYADANSKVDIQRDIQVLRSDGSSYHWLRVMLNPVFDMDGNYVETIGSAFEIPQKQ